ncbi:30 kDa heat shock protein [Aspergillus udagawae]|nr:30 kDa heat shock protein [Aspergillus udagawae]
MYTRRLLNFPLRHFATRPSVIRSLRPRQPWQTRTMSLMQRNPGAGFPSLSRALNDLESFLNRPAGSHDVLGHSPRFDVRETKDNYRLDGELPGVDKKDIEIELSDDNILTIKGRSERESTSEDPEQSWWCSERSVGEFRRSFRFPNDVDRDGIDASLKDGVLSITIPKTAESTVSKRIDIK